MPALAKGDIVIAFFPQEDHSSADLRPCLVLSVEEEHFTAAKITTTELRQIWAFKLEKGRESTFSGNIQRTSWVNLRRCETMPIQDAKHTVAKLKTEILEEICNKLDSLIEQ
jgi:mRNA-degrading endonuclease toxin of MazEF toxin-antitoxin module